MAFLRYFVLVAALALLALGAPNACRDTAACCNIVKFDNPAWNGANTIPVEHLFAYYADIGLTANATQISSTTRLPYQVGLFNSSYAWPASNPANGFDSLRMASDNYALSTFASYSTLLLRREQTLQLYFAHQPACVASVRTLRSVEFAVRQSVKIVYYRFTTPGDPTSTPINAGSQKVDWKTADQLPPVTRSNDFEISVSPVEMLSVEFTGQGFGAVSSVELCFSSPWGRDACGICGGDGSSCAGTTTGTPGGSCNTGMSGACAAGMYDDSNMCVPVNWQNIESCNNIDDNCNGEVDEGDWGVVSCGVGACYREYSKCMNGQVNTRCVPAAPSTEVCNDGIDNDCDGVVDNGCAPSDPPTASPSAPATRSPTAQPTPPASSSAQPTPPPTGSPMPSESATPSLLPSASTLPLGPGVQYIIPVLRCVRHFGASQYEAVFGYMSRGSTNATDATLSMVPTQTVNWLSSSSGTTLAQQQPTVFRLNAIVNAAFSVVFGPNEEVQWAVAVPGTMQLGPRQVAVANRYSAQCLSDGVPAFMLEPVQPLLAACVQQVSGSLCSASFAYYNPNPQTVQLDVGAGSNEFVAYVSTSHAPVQQADKGQTRVFEVGTVAPAFTVELDCSANLWAYEWVLSTLGTARTVRVDQQSVCT